MSTTTTDTARHLTTSRRLLTSTDVAETMGFSVRTLWRLVAKGDFPPPIRWNRKLVRWSAEAIERYLTELCGEPSLPPEHLSR
jgi:predicted DNA-binding transcriptional regulator AlpA